MVSVIRHEFESLDPQLASSHVVNMDQVIAEANERRVYIPKTDGRQRPLGIAALEDKIVQQAVVIILNQIYEADFKGFSYGFRPGRNPRLYRTRPETPALHLSILPEGASR